MSIKDLTNGTVRKYGTNHHDSLRISDDGRTLSYENLQNGDGSEYGDYRFVVDEDGNIPADYEAVGKYGADAYFNIGGFLDKYLTDRPCSVCKFHTEHGCSKWECVFTK